MLEQHVHGPILELRLARPPANALDPALLAALRRAIEDAPRQGARALILSGAPGFFSGGLDVPVLLGLTRADLLSAWGDFFGAMRALACSEIPTVAAITGHSPAGGAVLSLGCDYRVMADGEFKIGLNEVQVGLYVPEPIQFALRRLVGAHRAERLMVAGAMIPAAEALRIGLVDELAPLDQVSARARSWAEAHLALPPLALQRTRAIARADLRAAFADPQSFPLDDFLERWDEPETQTCLRALVERLKSRK